MFFLKNQVISLKGRNILTKRNLTNQKYSLKEIQYLTQKVKNLIYIWQKFLKKKENTEEEEINLKIVLLLNPKNDEAIYMLTLIKIDQSDYNEAENLINTFTLVCKSFCSKKKEIELKFKKLNPENAKNNN